VVCEVEAEVADDVELDLFGDAERKLRGEDELRDGVVCK
jgi:hypothetical protein